jgi:rubrerythrin
VSGSHAGSASVRSAAASAWRFRWRVELEAEVRFRSMAARLAALGAAPGLVALARRAASDEHRHARRCAEMARELGAELREPAPAEAREIAPPGLLPRGRILYELVAACCITETESMGVLTTLLAAARSARLRAVLRELASDEVRHSRLGWAHLAGEHAAGVTAFLGPLVPAMLQGSVPRDLFQPAAGPGDDAALLEYGVLPHRQKREVFTRTLTEVVFPGLARFGVDPAPARAWLGGKVRAPGRQRP